MPMLRTINGMRACYPLEKKAARDSSHRVWIQVRDYLTYRELPGGQSLVRF
jgi:hypothetical protein